jgi:hypothetical protein
MRKYVDHHICEECNGADTEAFFAREQWRCPNKLYTVDRYKGRLGTFGDIFPCIRLHKHHISSVIRREVCEACEYYSVSDTTPSVSWACGVDAKSNFGVSTIMAPWADIPVDCPKKMEHCVAAAGDYDEQDA